MLIVNFPHNPTGVTISRDIYQNIIKLVSEVGAYLLWDAAFEELVYDDLPLPNPYTQYDKTIYINTLTKCYGLAGLRIGWCISSPMVINKCKILKDYTTLYVSPINELIGVYVINNLKKFLNKRLDDVKRNLITLEQWLSENEKKVYAVLPQGGVSTFVKLNSIANTKNFCEILAINKKVLLVPGECFDFKQYIRLGIGTSPENLKYGLKIISEHLCI